MPGTPKRMGPAFLAAAAANVLNPPANTYAIITHIHVANQDVADRTFSMWVGATGASADGTELFESTVVKTKSYVDYYPRQRLDVADFLTGLASVASQVIITIDYELYAL
jgi:hypothetical protein